MFAIYDIDGRRFRNTLENLRKVRETRASPNTLLWPEPGDDQIRQVPGDSDSNNGDAVVSGKAVQAYRDMRHLNQREPIYHAHQLMSHPVSTVPIEMGILDAHRLFLERKVQQMPVMTAQQHIAGMLSLENLLQFIIIDDDQIQYVDNKRVADAMSQEVITADPVSDIRRVAQVMLEYHLDAVPIVDEHDALIGIVSRSDIMRAVMNDPPLTMWS